MDAFKSGNDALLEAAQDIYYPCDFVGKNISDVLASARPVHYMEVTELKYTQCVWCGGAGVYENYFIGFIPCRPCKGSGKVPVDSREGNS